MEQATLRNDLLALLKLIHQQGSTVCVGTCEHRWPGELHCHGIANILKMSSSGAKTRLREMVEMGIVTKDIVEREDGKVVARWTVSKEGLKYLTD